MKKIKTKFDYSTYKNNENDYILETCRGERIISIIKSSSDPVQYSFKTEEKELLGDDSAIIMYQIITEYGDFMTNDEGITYILGCRECYASIDRLNHIECDFVANTSNSRIATDEETIRLATELREQLNLVWNPINLKLEPIRTSIVPKENKITGPFNRGDVIVFDGEGIIAITKDSIGGSLYLYVRDGIMTKDCRSKIYWETPRLGNSSHMEKLMDSLQDLGCFWNRLENKLYEFNPDDLCLMKKSGPNYQWTLCRFSHVHKSKNTLSLSRHNSFVAEGGNCFRYCIPFIESTKELIGKSDEITY
jgi:hypothetical protein